MFRLPPPIAPTSLGEQISQALMVGLRSKQAEEERQLEKAQMQHRLKAMKFQEDQAKQQALESEAQEKRKQFDFVFDTLQGTSAPPQVQGIPESDPFARMDNPNSPRIDMSGASVVPGRHPEMQVPGTNQRVRPLTLEEVIQQKAAEEARKAAAQITGVENEAFAREKGQRRAEAQIPVPATAKAPAAEDAKVIFPPALAKLEGLSEYAGKEMTKREMDDLISANRFNRSEKRMKDSSDKKEAPADTTSDVSFLLTGGTADKLPIKVRTQAVEEARKSGGVDGTGFVPLNTTQLQKYSDFRDLQAKALRLESLLADPEIQAELGPVQGRITGFIKEFPGAGKSTKVKEAFDLFKDLSDTELRKRSGAAIAQDEYNRIVGFTVDPTKQADSNKTNLTRMIQTINRSLHNMGANVGKDKPGKSIDDILSKYDKK